MRISDWSSDVCSSDLLHSEIFELVQQISVERPGRGDSLEPVRDLDQLRNFLSGGGPLAIADLPWMLFFIAVLTLLHWTLGLTVLVGGLALLALTLAADRLTRAPTSIMTRPATLRIAVAETTRRHAEVLKAMDLGPHLQRQWTERSRAFLDRTSTRLNSSH